MLNMLVSLNWSAICYMYACTSKISKDRVTQSIVFKVNIVSPKNHHVNIGNTRYDIANAKNLTLHTDSLKAANPNLVP